MSNILKDFSDKLAAIMPEIGSDRLPSLLLAMLKSLVPFDNALIIHYDRNETPSVHYNDIPPLERESQIDLFVNGAYLLDPFYRAAVDKKRSGLHRHRGWIMPSPHWASHCLNPLGQWRNGRLTNNQTS